MLVDFIAASSGTGVSQGINVVMLIGCYIAILSHAVWTFKSIQETRSMVFRHENKAGIHTDSKDLMFRDVCDERIRRMNDKIEGVRTDVKDIKEGMEKGFDKLEQLIKESA